MGYTRDQVMNVVFSQLGTSLAQELYTDKATLKFFESRKTCQFECLGEVGLVAFKTMYGKFGKDFDMSNRHTEGLMLESVAGNLRACFPSPPRAKIYKLGRRILENIKKALKTG